MAVSDIMLRVGTELGPGGFASLESAINMVVQLTGAIADQIRKLDEFQEAYSRTTIRVSEVIDATSGLVDSMSIMSAANKVAQADLKITTDQMAAIAKVATEYADATGGDAAAETERLTEALIRGSSRGLKPYGIELKDGQTQAEAFAEGLGKITERADDLTIDADTVTDSIEKMANSFNSLSGILWSESGVGVTKPLIFVFNKIGDAINYIGSVAEKAGSRVMSFSGALAMIKASFGFKSDLFEMFKQQSMDDWIAAGNNPEDYYAIQDNEEQSVQTDKVNADGLSRIERKSADSLSKQSRGGGGRKKQMEEFIFSEEEVAQIEQEDLLGGYAKTAKEIKRGFDLYGTASEPDQAEAVKREAEARAFQMLVDEYDRYIERIEAEKEKQQELMDAKADFAGQFADAWNSAYSQVTSGAMLATGVIDAMHASTNAVFNSIILGQGSVKKAVWAAVRDTAISVAVESTFQALFETAKGIAELVSSWGMSPKAEGHFLAAATFTATAILATTAAALAAQKAGGAGGGHSSATPSAGASKGAGSYGASYGAGMYNNGGTNGGDTKVVVVLKGDAGKLFDTVSAEQDKRRASGYREARTAA